MPFCDPCNQYWAPTALTVEGKCPKCGQDVAAHQARPETTEEPTPWHFKLLVVMVILYLGWRFLELFGWF